MIWLSPSQITTFRHCRRKWGWRYLDGLKLPPNPAAQEGLAGHTILERYFRTAELTPYPTKALPGISRQDLTDLCSKGLYLYPPPGTPGLQIEHHFGVNLGGFLIHGYKDLQLLQRNQSYCPGCAGLRFPEQCPHCMPQIWDHKFTSNLRYAKQDSDLQSDVQSVIYALDGMLASARPAVRCNWVYYQRRGAQKVARAVAVLRADHLVGQLAEIRQTSYEIHEAYDKYETALQLPPTASACRDYGGCVYMHNCNLSTRDAFVSMLTSQSAKVIFSGYGTVFLNPPGGHTGLVRPELSEISRSYPSS
jgi:hypothetical protein